jgi:phosphatidylglycerophosphate synthase
MSAADCVTFLRLLLVPFIWLLALQGQGRLVGFGLILAGVTDVLDGYLARRLGQVSTRGARLDAVADLTLLVSAAGWLQLLHPEIARDNGALLATTAALYAGGVTAGLIVFRRVVDPRQLTSKIAGGSLYVFAVITLLTGDYEPLLLRLALLALIVSSVESIVTAIRTIQASGIASSNRSQAPQASNDVASSPSPITSIPTSAMPTANEIRP